MHILEEDELIHTLVVVQYYVHHLMLDMRSQKLPHLAYSLCNKSQLSTQFVAHALCRKSQLSPPFVAYALCKKSQYLHQVRAN